ncbi:MAG: glycosyltransferase, partial [Spirochaetaceae bacterium]
MNIAIFLDCFYPMKNGVITSAMQLKEGLDKKGHHVVIVSLRVPGYRERHPDIMLFPMIPMDFGSKQSFGPAIISPGRLLKFLRKHKIDIIHSHTEFTLGYASLFAAKALKVPRVVTSHTLWSDYSNYNILLRYKVILYNFMRIYYCGIRAIIAPSVKSKRFNDILVPKIPKYIVPNGIDVFSFKGKPVPDAQKAERMSRLGILPDDDVLIFVGRIGPEKRVMKMLKAFAPLMRKRKNLKLMFVGDGPDRGNLVALAA